MSVSARRHRPARLAAGLTMTALVVLAAGACSADDTGPAPESSASTSSTEISAETAGSGTTGTETTTATSAAPTRTTTSSSRGSGAGAASTMTCAEFRDLDDAERSAVLTDLDVTANAEQVATVAATVCLSRPGDTIAAVVAELVGR